MTQTARMKSTLKNVMLLKSLVAREVSSRYRGSTLGIVWAVATPLFMLTIYTFVFGTVFRAKIWPSETGASNTSSFALTLFTGLIIFTILAETLSRAPSIIRSHANFVKKVVFPIYILPLVPLGSAVTQALISILVLFTVMLLTSKIPPPTALLLFIPLVPFLILTAGLSWIVACLGTYVRDLEQVMPSLLSGLMFLSAIFYPLSALPEWARVTLLWLNPAVLPIEETRKILLFGLMPDWIALGIYFMISVVVAIIGYATFRKLSKGFADVI